MALTFEELGKYFENIKEELPAILGGMELIVANEAKGLHKQRLSGGISSDGSTKRYRSESYRKLRAKKGLQTNVVDLQNKGDLFRNMTVGTEGGDVVYGVVNAPNGKTNNSTIYKGLVEKGYGGLLELSSDEVAQSIEKGNKFLNDKLNEIL